MAEAASLIEKYRVDGGAVFLGQRRSTTPFGLVVGDIMGISLTAWDLGSS